MSGDDLIHPEEIQSRIHTISGVQVMPDEDLALLYGVKTKVLNQAVKRNSERFPEEFMFQITDDEFNRLKSQIVISNQRGGRRYLPYAFTEQGIAMLSAVLRSETAIEISVKIIDAFVTMHRFIFTNAQVFQRLDTLETKQPETDEKIDYMLNALIAENLWKVKLA